MAWASIGLGEAEVLEVLEYLNNCESTNEYANIRIYTCVCVCTLTHMHRCVYICISIYFGVYMWGGGHT